MSFIGLGSVSGYCLHNSLAPTLVVRFAQGKEPVLGAEACPPPATSVSNQHALWRIMAMAAYTAKI